MESYKVRFKDFPEFYKVPDEIVIGPDYLDKLAEKSKREKRVQWLERYKGMTPKGNSISKTKTKHGWVPVEKRIEVVSAYCAGVTSAVELEKLTKVPAGTIRVWKTREWWPEMIERVRLEKDEEFDAKFTKIIDKTLDRIVDALENGDYHMDRLGEIHRKPVNARDAAAISKVVIDKRNLLRGKPTSRTANMTDTEHLNKLAAEFKKFAGAKTIKHKEENDDVLTVDFIEVENNAKEIGERIEEGSQEEAFDRKEG